MPGVAGKASRLAQPTSTPTSAAPPAGKKIVYAKRTPAEQTPMSLLKRVAGIYKRVEEKKSTLKTQVFSAQDLNAKQKRLVFSLVVNTIKCEFFYRLGISSLRSS